MSAGALADIPLRRRELVRRAQIGHVPVSSDCAVFQSPITDRAKLNPG
jgi:hypothetical protein